MKVLDMFLKNKNAGLSEINPTQNSDSDKSLTMNGGQKKAKTVTFSKVSRFSASFAFSAGGVPWDFFNEKYAPWLKYG